MNEFDARIVDELHWSIPDVSHVQPDWGDVAARALLLRRSNVTRRRRILVAAIAAVLAAAVVAPSFGVGTRLLDFFGLAAPKNVKKVVDESQVPTPGLVSWLRAHGRLDIDNDSLRGIAQVQTPGGFVQLWGAQSRDGAVAVRFVQIPGSGPPRGILTGIDTTRYGPKLDAGVATAYDYPVLTTPLLHGQVNPPVATVSVVYPDGLRQLVPIIDGYFLVRLERDAGTLVVEARDAGGSLVTDEVANLDPPKPPVIAETRLLISVPFPGGTARLFVTPARDPSGCFRVVALTGSSGSCPGLSGGEIGFGFHQVGEGTNATVLLAGVVPSDIDRLRLRLATGWVSLPLKEGFFLFALRPDQRPELIETKSRSGTVERIRPVQGR